MNYILLYKNKRLKNLDEELIEVGDGMHRTIIDFEIDPEREFGRTILEFSHQNDEKIYKEVSAKKQKVRYFDVKQSLLDSYIESANKGSFHEIPLVKEMSKIIKELPDYEDQ
jgi:hypothetical protein